MNSLSREWTRAACVHTNRKHCMRILFYDWKSALDPPPAQHLSGKRCCRKLVVFFLRRDIEGAGIYIIQAVK